MTMRSLVRIFIASIAFSSAAGLTAQQPTVLHSQVTSETATHGLKEVLDGAMRESAPVWIGYSVPVANGFSTSWGTNSVEYLEHRGEDWIHESDQDTHRSDHAVILLRVANGAVTRVVVESADRQLDASGLKFIWLNGVDADDSVKTLAAIAKGSEAHQLRDNATFAISLHQAGSATTALVGLTQSGNDLGLRENAAFWLANERGRDGFLAIQRMAHEDGDADFREKLTFDLTLSKEPAAMDELIRMAHDDASPKVRKQAQFWMATKGGKKVSGDLRALATDDPNEQVRKSAVFALSRLPGDEAATQLIAVADSSKDPAVRKQAIFWLGQSSDPRALDYLTKLLKQ
jgi:hypothetical protein